MMRILLDTNFFIDLIRFKIDLDEISNLIGKYELFTLDSVVTELKEIAKTKSRESNYAKVALNLIKNKRVKILKAGGETDKAILRLADQAVVATNDAKLRKILKTRGTKTIYIRARKYLAIS